MKSKSQTSNLPQALHSQHAHSLHLVAKLLGLPIYKLSKVTKLIKYGFSLKLTENIIKQIGMNETLIKENCNINLNNVRRRKLRKLTRLESDRLYRLIKLYAMAEVFFEGDDHAATTWLLTPNQALWNSSPLQCSITLPGYDEVEQLIGRLTHGVF